MMSGEAYRFEYQLDLEAQQDWDDNYADDDYDPSDYEGWD